MRHPVKVTWADSYGVTNTWESEKDASDNQVETIESYGIIVKMDKDKVVLSSHFSSSESVTGCMIIPKLAIKSIETLVIEDANSAIPKEKLNE